MHTVKCWSSSGMLVLYMSLWCLFNLMFNAASDLPLYCYGGKSEAVLHIRLIKPHNDIYKTNMPGADQHFSVPGHNFN